MDSGEFVYLDSVLMGYFVFGLVLTRMSGFMISAQFFSTQQIPIKAKVGFAIFLAVCCYPTASATFVWSEQQVLNSSQIILLGFEELVIGLAIGLLSTIIFNAAQLAGQIAGQQIGFAMANVVDPLSNLNVSIIGFMWAQIASMIFLLLNLHLYLIWLMDRSFEYIRIGSLAFDPFLLACLEGISLQTDSLFLVGLQITMPIILIMLMSNVIIGFITRTMPQMNIMVFGMPLRIVLGLMAVTFMIPGLVDMFAGGGIEDIWLASTEDGILRDMLDRLAETIEAMTPGVVVNP